MKRTAGVLFGVLFVVVVAVVLAVQLIDWNRARPWINSKVSAASGRHFEIKGDLDAHWVWPQPLDSGWRHWVPGVRVQAQALELGNLEDFGAFGALTDTTKREQLPLTSAASVQTTGYANAATKNAEEGVLSGNLPLMATIGQLSASVRLLPLLARTVLIDTLQLGDPDIALARASNGKNNWTFPRKAQEGEVSSNNPWSIDVGQLTLLDGQLAYADEMQKLAIRAQVSSDDDLQQSGDDGAASTDTPRYGLRIKVRGEYGDAKVQGSGRAGQLLSLRKDSVQYPVTFELQAGKTRASATGTLSNPRQLAGVDMVVSLSGDNMADLYELTGLVLPSTPPFKTKGHLVGSLEAEHATWDYQDFSGAVGDSDLEGHLTYTSAKPRPMLKGQIKSRKLQLADLGSIVGAPQDNAAKNKSSNARIGKVLPDSKFATGRWDAMDMDIAFLGETLIGPSSLPLEDMSVRAILKDGNLRLDPLRFGIAKGRIDANLFLDGKSDPLKVEMQATVDDLRLSALFPDVDLLDKSLGRMDGAFALQGSGASVADILASSNGESRVYIRDGTFSKQLLDLAGLNLGSVLVTKLFGGDEEVKLRCAVADFGIKDGIAQTRSVKLSTAEAIVEAVGTIDFGNEYIDLRIKPESLEWKFLSLRTPIRVRGPFIKPEVSIEAGPLLARAGAAVIAAVAAPAALALIPITVPAAEDDAQCEKLLARADDTVKAGPAGAKTKPDLE